MTDMSRMLGVLAIGASLALPCCTKPNAGTTDHLLVLDGGELLQSDPDGDGGMADASHGQGDGGGSDTDADTMDSGIPNDHEIDQTPRDGTIGASCSVGYPGTSRGTCDAGLSCMPNFSVAGMCTLLGCATDSDCGVNGLAQNVCVQNGSDGQKSCFRGCDFSASNPCGRDDFVCVLNAAPNGAALCLPDCRTPFNDCPYMRQCNQTTGRCEARPPCSSGSSSCAAGMVCYAEADGEGQNVSECVPDCTLRGNECPNGRECDGANTRACKRLVKDYYDECGPNIGVCDPISACVRFDELSAVGICLQTCRFDEDCPGQQGTSRCNFPVTGGINVCTVECIPGNGNCNDVTYCKTLTDPNGKTYGPLCAN